MERMLAVFAGDPMAAGAGLLGMICLAAWPLFQARPAMLAMYLGNNFAFMAHYALLHHWTAVAMNAVMGVQTVVAIAIIQSPRLRWVYYALVPVLAGMCLMTWDGLPSFFAAAAATFSTIGRLQDRALLLRLLLLAAMPCWAAHDLVVGSLPGLCADILSMAVGACMLLRHHYVQGDSFMAGNARAH